MARKLMILAAAAGGLLCTTASAEPATGLPNEVRIATADDVKALCAELSGDRARRPRADTGDDATVYVVTLTSDAFELGAYDTTRARLPVEDARGFRPPRGGFELVLHDLAGGAAAPARPVLDMAVPASADEAKTLQRAHRSGSLDLTLWFLPAARSGTPICAVVHRGSEDGIRMAIEPLAFAITKGREHIASGELPAFTALREAQSPSPVVEPHVIVSPPMRTTVNGRAPEPVTRAATALAPSLVGCYRKGLADEPTLRGSLVAGVEVAASGKVTSVHAEIDGLGAPTVVSCALDVVRGARFPKGTAERLSIPMKFTD